MRLIRDDVQGTSMPETSQLDASYSLVAFLSQYNIIAVLVELSSQSKLIIFTRSMKALSCLLMCKHSTVLKHLKGTLRPVLTSCVFISAG